MHTLSIAAPQSITMLILGSPYANTSTQTALQFAQAVLSRGHTITRIFFYHEAATVGNALSISAQDENNLPAAWQTFIQQQQLDAVICIASGLKRGIIDAEEASRYQKAQHNLHPAIELSGLGQWVDAVSCSDKHIVFG